jgi:UDP-N-acetylglucosamine acyltransferase
MDLGKILNIHPTAVVHPGANIHPSVLISPYSVIGPMVSIGPNTKIGAHCVIGGPPEHKDHWDRWGFGVSIGEECFISNGVTIDSGIENNTSVGNRVTILRQAHVGHDAQIEDDVTLSCSVLVGGHSRVMRFANCGLGAIIHQRSLIGFLSMLGMGTIVTKKTPIRPCGIYVGNPAAALRRNDVGIDRSGLSEEQLNALLKEYSELVNSF